MFLVQKDAVPFKQRRKGKERKNLSWPKKGEGKRFFPLRGTRQKKKIEFCSKKKGGGSEIGRPSPHKKEARTRS